MKPDPFLTELYDRLHDSPMQRKFRRIAPMPFGIVFLPHPGMTEDDVRTHFRLARELGFNAMKQTMENPLFPVRRIRQIALEEGIIPWWYGEGGWDEITDGLMEKLGIAPDTPIQTLRRHPKMLAHQAAVLRARIDREEVSTTTGKNDAPWEGVPHSVGPEFDKQFDHRFLEWLQRHYPSIEALNLAWNMHHIGIAPDQRPFTDWADVGTRWRDMKKNEYRHLRDQLRFKADEYIAHIRHSAAAHRQNDAQVPFRAGGEMGLFLPFAARATDMEGIAEAMTEVGSFYPSIHLAWHLEEVNYEVPRMIYMQASIAADWFKGGWSATWESTGGPQQFSGGKAWNPDSAKQTAGFTVDAGTITQLLLSYLAAGFKGVGLWCWNARTAGWEAGEYAMLDRNDQPTERAIRAGQIAKAADRYRDELWQARKEPIVGVYQDWDNEAIWAALANVNRDKFKFEPIHARVGVSRALINANVPWEHVTATDLRRGLAARYRAIYLPRILALNTDLLPIFLNYVRGGGRLVLDLPGAWFDAFGRLLPTGEGSDFEQLFGVTLNDFQYARNVPRSIGDLSIKGFVADLTLTAAAAIARYDNGKPAITENHLGNGSAILLGCEASHTCFALGQSAMEKLLIDTTLGAIPRPYACSGALVYRLAALDADHYFLINDGAAKSVRLETPAYSYSGVLDVLTNVKLDNNEPITLDPHSARWLRLVR